MRVIFAGSRKHRDKALVFQVLEQLFEDNGPFVLVHGACATGADAWASEWYELLGKARGCTEIRYPAEWERYATSDDPMGKKAGPLRNIKMVKAGADLVVAFPLPDSKGTVHTMALAQRAGIPLKVYESE